MKQRTSLFLAIAGVAVLVAFAAACGTSTSTGVSGDAASQVYVAPGEYDDFYAFMSGGYSGQISVYGLPSGRLFRVIPVFSQDAEKAYGYSEETKPMLMTSHGFIPWDDAHHPELSQTDGVPDGRWIFINGNNTPRVARIDLASMNTAEILEIPNSSGNHASPFVTPNNEYVVAATRFSIPIPNADIPLDSLSQHMDGTLTFIRADQPGEMDIAFQILVPGFNYDLAHSGKGASDGWAFFTTYNTEQATTLLEVNASRNDKDFIAAVNWRRAEECVAGGAGEQVEGTYYHNRMDERHMAVSDVKNGVRMITPADCDGLVYFLPTPKSPHGVDVDPTGQYIVGGGKLSTVIPVHSFAKMLDAIENERFETTVDGIPVLEYEAILHGEVENPGLGPLHTEFDGTGHAYTSAFLSSEIVKWNIERTEVVDRVPTYYSVGHLMIPGGDSQQPWGQYVVALNKITKDRYLPTGPELAHSAQLYDISGDRMRLILDFPTIGEPHYAQALPAELIRDRQVQIYELSENLNPHAIATESEARVERVGGEVHVYMSTIRTHFAPDNIEGIKVGDDVYFHVTNLEQDWDVPHGFAVIGANNSELLVMPGETRTLRWRPQRVGIHPFYCTDFCSALHQEMQGYIRVSPEGSNVPISFHTGRRPAAPTTP
nr:nitrous-oxide reductase [uncultured bacterium]